MTGSIGTQEYLNSRVPRRFPHPHAAAGGPRGGMGAARTDGGSQGQAPTGRGVLREIRLRVRTDKSGSVEILKSVLVSCGVPPEELVELTQDGRQYVLFYPTSSSKARRVTGALRKINARGVRPETKFLSRKDWQNRWKKDFKPFVLGKNFYVVPAGWSRKYKSKMGSRIPIILDTAMAFGSGLHETTRFMVQLIEFCHPRFGSFLDIGTGTGILAIAAAKCGVRDIHAIDFNPDCVQVARANFRRNGCGPSSLAAGDIHRYPPRKQYDLVAANLVTHNLVKAGRKLVSLVRPGKYLAVSGISLENVPVLRRAFRKYPLRPLKTIRGREWAALLYQKTRKVNDVRSGKG